MKEIKLKHGEVVLVDDADFERLNQYQWRPLRASRPGNFYAVRSTKTNFGWTTELMHRHLVGVDGLDTDHIDGNGLNNQRANLRVCTRSQNQCNRSKVRNNKSGFKGVRIRDTGRYEAKINYGGKYIHLGSFTDALEAARAYNTAAQKMFGEFAQLNEVPH